MVQVVLLTGPGNHAHLLQATLAQQKRLHTVFEYYPSWVLVQPLTGRKYGLWGYKSFIKALWAVGRRLPYYRRYNPHRYWEYQLYDFVCRLHLPKGVPILWAWSQTSLYTMKEARKRGMKVLLELPASHPTVWEETVQKAYAAFASARTGYAFYLPAHRRRIEEELEVADRIHVLSSFVQLQLLRQGIPAEKVRLLPLGVDARHFSPPAEPPPSRPFRFLYVGRLEPLKGVHLLLEAFHRLRWPKESAELWLAGPIVEEMEPVLRRYADHFVYKGTWERAYLPELYRQAHAFVFPTLLDSFGLVLLEAMACGLPVIATSHSAAPDLVTEGKDGYVVPPFSVEALMEAMEKLYRMPVEERLAMSCAARQKVESAWTLTHYAERIAAYLAEYEP